MDSRIGMESDRNENLKKSPLALAGLLHQGLGTIAERGLSSTDRNDHTTKQSSAQKKTHLLKQADICNNLSLGGGGGGGKKKK